MSVAWTQVGFRGRNDDGSQLAATFKAAANTNWQQAPGLTFRIRFDVSETGTTSSTHTGQLSVNKNGGAFQNVTGSSTIVKAVSSANITDDQATTQIISSGTFVAGKCDINDGVTAATSTIASGSHTEMEYCVQINDADVANGDTIQLRDTQNGTVFGTYTNTPTITVRKTALVASAATMSGTISRLTKWVTGGSMATFAGVITRLTNKILGAS